MYPSLRKTATNPSFILNKAQQNLRSKQKEVYIFVEGTNDKKFLKNLGLDKKEIGFDGFDGKPLVKKLLSLSKQNPYTIFSKSLFIMDIDYDSSVGNLISHDNNVFYHGYCNINNQHEYNDLEVFLWETKAFQKILNEFEIEEDATSLRNELSILASEIGYLKLADEILVKENNLRSSILDGFNIESSIRISDFTFLEKDVYDSLKIRSPHKEYVEDLFEKIKQLKEDYSDIKICVKGHDLTKILEIYLKHKGKHWANKTNLEMTLRVGFEADEYLKSSLGKSLLSRESIKDLF
ncbi:hypothetical protein V5F22_17155 [Acinetobacter baumannii]|uniref:hypothetical protein n=1 Tax=Acinetobacter baumannii TaxID=470 RepID=UPI000DE6F6F7|nr:hypothetical protein [Acinetobacter baumannii]MDN8430360.1 hypothetical protein [Acinetobacter baumannii]MDV4266376.1 hypothetical protein [Acinetobacter baumannii]SSR41628.1 Uncharacterised protein [Acinetobacter baumannii]